MTSPLVLIDETDRPLTDDQQVTSSTPATTSSAAATDAWMRSIAINVARHAAALRPFRPDEFGTGAASPSPGHLDAVNKLLAMLGDRLERAAATVRRAADRARQEPTSARLLDTVTKGEQAHDIVRATEQLWDWYFEFFGQRQTRFAEWLLSCDRIALDAYQDVYMGLGRARSVPAPPPMTYMRFGMSPSTYRRNTRLQRLGYLPNPFPIIQIPLHRLQAVWTLGAILHETSHNLQNELGLARTIPAEVHRRLTAAGFPAAIVRVWVRWNRETFADLLALLLGGPSVLGSLIDILARRPRSVLRFNPGAVHPLPLLRTRISTELLRRMGFPLEANQYREMWDRTYAGLPSQAPAALMASAPGAIGHVVDAMCYTSFPTLGDKSLAQVFSFAPKHQELVEEAGGRLARGVDPGVIPERFLIGAARYALDRRLATPETITTNFYRDLSRR